MAKVKFDMEEIESATNDATLKAVVKKKVLKDILVRGIPVDTYNTLKENGLTFAGFAKAAVQEKMKRDGLI